MFRTKSSNYTEDSNTQSQIQRKSHGKHTHKHTRENLYRRNAVDVDVDDSLTPPPLQTTSHFKGADELRLETRRIRRGCDAVDGVDGVDTVDDDDDYVDAVSNIGQRESNYHR